MTIKKIKKNVSKSIFPKFPYSTQNFCSRDVVSSVEARESLTLTTVKSARYKRRIETDVPRSSIWAAQRQICFMK